jgi:hypothetical protein
MRRLTYFVVLVAFICSCGGQWYVLQGVAWARMVMDYSQVVPLTQAVQMTFSGEYPCAICKALAEKKQSENAKVFNLDKSQKKLSSPAFVLARPFPSVSSRDFVLRDEFFQTRSEAPPTPPPRLA